MRRLAILLGDLFSWAFAVVVIVTLYEVIARYLFNSPTTWAQELAMLLSAVAFAIGGAYVQAQDAHIRVTVLTERLAEIPALAIDVFSRLLGIIFLAGIIHGGWRDAWEALSGWQTTQSAFNSPMPAVVKPVVIGVSLLMALLLAADIVRQVGKAAKPKGAAT